MVLTGGRLEKHKLSYNPKHKSSLFLCQGFLSNITIYVKNRALFSAAKVWTPREVWCTIKKCNSIPLRAYMNIRAHFRDFT